MRSRPCGEPILHRVSDGSRLLGSCTGELRARAERLGEPARSERTGTRAWSRSAISSGTSSERHLAFGRRLDRIEHFTLERVPSLLDDRVWRAHPTNGAAVVST